MTLNSRSFGERIRISFSASPRLCGEVPLSKIALVASRGVCYKSVVPIPFLGRIFDFAEGSAAMSSVTFNAGRLMGLTSVVLAVIGAPVRADDATYLLKYKFQPGQFLYYEVENAMTIVTQFDTAKEEVSNTSQAWKQLRVVAVDEAGNAVLEPMVERVKMAAIKDEEDPVRYDSLTDADPPFQFRDIKKTVGTVIARVNVAPNGDLNQVTPLIHDNESLNEAAKKNDSRLNFLIVMPKTPIKIGDSWKDRFQADVTVDKGLKREITMQRTYQLTEVKGSIAVIKLKTSVVTPANDPQIEVQLIQRTPAGIIEFDLEKGMILSMKTEVNQSVLGAFGPKSSMSAVTKSTEKLLPARPEFKTASGAVPTSK